MNNTKTADIITLSLNSLTQIISTLDSHNKIREHMETSIWKTRVK